MCPATADHRPWLNRTIREAKSLQQTLKDSLKTKDPWDKETDFTRKQCVEPCMCCCELLV